MTLLCLRTTLPLLLTAGLIFMPGCRRALKPVAQVGETTINQTQWKLYLSEQPKGADSQAALKDLVRREIAWVQAGRMGLLNTEAWQATSPKLQRKVLSQAYLESLLGKSAPTESEVRDFYLSHSEERHVLHLLTRSQEAAAAARARLDKGEAFEKVARAVSVDPSVSKNLGDLGWIKRDAIVPEFAKEIFTAKDGALCGPFRTEFGWHVALMKERRAPGPEAFEANKAVILAQAMEMAIKPRREDAIVPLRAKYPLTVDEGNVAVNPTAASAAADGKRIVGKVGDTSITLRELHTYIQEALGGGGPDHPLSPATRKKFLELYCDDIRLEMAAQKAGIDKRAEVQAALWQAQRQAVYMGFTRNYLRKLAVPDADLAAHLQANPGKFRAVGAVKVYLLVAHDQAAAGVAAHEAQKGLPWQTLVARHANRESTGTWDAGFLEVAALKKILPAEVVKALTTSPIDTVVGPVDGPEGPMLFKVLARKPGEVPALEQCRDEVRMDYLNACGEKLVEAYLDDEGRKDIRVQIHENNLNP